jgi:hypothetical protein
VVARSEAPREGGAHLEDRRRAPCVWRNAPHRRRAGWALRSRSSPSPSAASAELSLPLVSVQTTLWAREVRKLLVRWVVTMRSASTMTTLPTEGEAWLPRLACKDCGHSAVVGSRRGASGWGVT